MPRDAVTVGTNMTWSVVCHIKAEDPRYDLVKCVNNCGDVIPIPPTGCRLLPSEADIEDALEVLGHGVYSIHNAGTFDQYACEIAIGHSDDLFEAPTRLAAKFEALIAALEADKEAAPCPPD